MSWNKRKIIMLPTDKKANLFLYKDNILQFQPGEQYAFNDIIAQHLYILSDEEIKEGDWFFRDSEIYQAFKIHENEIEFKTSPYSVYCGKNTFWDKQYCKKIIVSTDKSLRLPEPSKSFIEAYAIAYNVGKPITEIMVEYLEPRYSAQVNSDLKREQFGSSYNLKVDKDNTITIRKVKDSYTREEVIALITEMFYAVEQSDDEFYRQYASLDKWIEENL